MKTEEIRASSSEIDLLVGDTLVDRGYSVSRMECQDWATHLSLNKPGLDGSLELFFGPMVEDSESGLREPYLIVREETRHAGFHSALDVSSAEVAQALVNRLDMVVNTLTTPHGLASNIGEGLVPVGSWDPPLQDA